LPTKINIYFLPFAMLCLALLPPCSAQQKPKPQGAARTGQYRNLFVEAGHSQKDVDARIQQVYQQLFHGPADQTLGYAAGANADGPLMYVKDIGDDDVRSEGMSYGMMIAVQLNQKADFDALWNWAKTYMYIRDPKHPSHGYFSWSVKSSGAPHEETPAPDGEEYFAMSLLFAAHRWPGGHGVYDYNAEAQRLLHDILHRETAEGQTKFGYRKLGSMIDPEHEMILFVPDRTMPAFTDPSYHLPAFYELWAQWGPVEDRAFWARAAKVSRDYFLRATDAKTGLAAAYANFDGSPHPTDFYQSGIFSCDAWRVAMNWSVDWSWWRADAREPELSDRIQSFFDAQGLKTYGNMYTREGKFVGPTPAPTVDDHSTGLVAGNAVAGLAARDRSRAKRFAEELWLAKTPTGKWRYYDGMLYLMGLMHAGGRFRVIGEVK